MENYRTSSHSRYDIKFHFVWVTKYRKPILTGGVGIRVRDLVRKICRTYDIEILQGSVSGDHVHVLLSCPPNLSASKIMQYIKGKTSRKLMDDGVQTYPKTILGSPFVGPGLLCGFKRGNVTDEAIMEYIRRQNGKEPDDGGDNFQVTQS